MGSAYMQPNTFWKTYTDNKIEHTVLSFDRDKSTSPRSLDCIHGGRSIELFKYDGNLPLIALFIVHRARFNTHPIYHHHFVVQTCNSLNFITSAPKIGQVHRTAPRELDR